MTAIPTEAAPSVPVPVLDAQHEHTSRCYWDLYECRWRCPVPDHRADEWRRGESNP